MVTCADGEGKQAVDADALQGCVLQEHLQRGWQLDGDGLWSVLLIIIIPQAIVTEVCDGD